jgi:hypothetical protein
VTPDESEPKADPAVECRPAARRCPAAASRKSIDAVSRQGGGRTLPAGETNLWFRIGARLATRPLLAYAAKGISDDCPTLAHWLRWALG